MEIQEYFVVVTTDNEEMFKDESFLFDTAVRSARTDLALNLKFKRGAPKKAFTTASNGEYHYWLSFPITPRKGILAWLGSLLDLILRLRGLMSTMSTGELLESFNVDEKRLKP